MKNNVIVRNNVTIQGSGEKTILFANGYGCDQNMWRFITPAFENSFKLILFDHVGSGNADQSAYDYDKYNSLEGYANDIIEICRELSLSNVILVGHSVSSVIIMLAAIKEPELFNKLIMVAPSPCYINQDDYFGGFSKEDIDELVDSLESNYLGWASAITPVIMGTPDKPELTEELTNSFCRNNPDISKHFAKVTFLSDNREDLTKFKQDTLIIQCSKDVIAPIQVGKYMHKMIPHNKLVIIEATGHCPHLSNPKQTIQAMKEFLFNH